MRGVTGPAHFQKLSIKHGTCHRTGYVYRPQTKFTKVMFYRPVSVCPQEGCFCPIACWDTPPGQSLGYGLQAGGTHSTGMHSCSVSCLIV